MGVFNLCIYLAEKMRATGFYVIGSDQAWLQQLAESGVAEVFIQCFFKFGGAVFFISQATFASYFLQ